MSAMKLVWTAHRACRPRTSEGVAVVALGPGDSSQRSRPRRSPLAAALLALLVLCFLFGAAASGDRRGRDRWLESPGPSATTATPSEVRGRHARCAVHTSFIALILLSNGDGELQRAPKPYTLAGVSPLSD